MTSKEAELPRSTTQKQMKIPLVSHVSLSVQRQTGQCRQPVWSQSSMAAEAGQYRCCEANMGKRSQGSAELISRIHGERREGPRHQGAEGCALPANRRGHWPPAGGFIGDGCLSVS